MSDDNDDLLTVTDLRAGYGRAALVLRGLDIAVPAGKVVCLVGPNGAGKSTVLRVIGGLLRPRGGTVRFDGADVTGLRPDQLLQRGIAFVLQGHSVFKEMTVADNIAMGAYTERDAAVVADRTAFVRDVFPLLGDRWNDLAGALSGGQQKMVEVARSLMVDPALVLMDEPTMGLDPKATATVFEQIDRLRSIGKAVLLVEQNARRALEIADTGCVLDLGTIAIRGPAPELLDRPELAQLYLGGSVTTADTAAASATDAERSTSHPLITQETDR